MSGHSRVEVYPGCEAVVEFDDALTFECVPECTWCCHHGVLLYGQDLRELAARESLDGPLKQLKGHDFIRRESKDREEFVDVDDQACYFLNDEGLCTLHAEHEWKPTRCSVFPLEIHVEDGDIHVSIREKAHQHCDGLDVSERKIVDHLDAFLPKLLWELDDPTSRIEL
ncbi:hypothetical protein [Halocatena halophila]|uniref:hypothetical protein n=1 Tax=Halocatena halophila TaxID=2814576 RepID=UPI002ED5A70A